MVDILTFLGDGLTQKQTFCKYPYKEHSSQACFQMILMFHRRRILKYFPIGFNMVNVETLHVMAAFWISDEEK
jgi:hypothetical protein